MPRILNLAPIDYRDWHAGLITVQPWDVADGGAESRLARVKPRYRPGARHA